jgi:transposase
MFVRTKSTPNSPRKSIQIVESVRDGLKVKQRILSYVGIAQNEKEVAQLRALAHERIDQLKRESRLEHGVSVDRNTLAGLSIPERGRGRPHKKTIDQIIPLNQVTLDLIEEEQRLVEGIHDIGGLVYDQLGYGSLLQIQKNKDLLKDLVLSRIVRPESKHRQQQTLQSSFGKEYDLDAIYRLLDKLHEQIPIIKSLTFARTQALSPDNVDVILFDVTTLYFESTESDELRKTGWSKDHRFTSTQVVLALATNGDGLPIGYELFKGNKAEVLTLCEAITEWEKLFKIGSVCFVGDRAMFSEKNLSLLEEKGYQYVVAAKLRTLPAKLQQELLDEKMFKITIFKGELAWVGEFEHDARRLIVSFSKKRAYKDAKDRETLITNIQKKLAGNPTPKKLLSNSGVKKFVNTSVGAKATLDEDKIKADAAWDGLHGVITNLSESDANAILERYSRLWVIEDAFRTNKHSLRMRPIFHFKPERIESHIALCYMAFSVLKHMQYTVSLTQKISVTEVIDELLGVQASIYVHKITQDRYRIPGNTTHKASKIYKAFNIVRSSLAEPYIK